MRHGEAAGAAHRRLQPWLHFALLGFWLKAPLALDFPPCNWTYCPVCFPDAKTELQNLTVQGRDGLRYSTPLRLAGQMDFWDSQAGLGQIVGILTEEKLGIRVEYVPCEDEFACVKAISGCADRDNGCQLVDTEAQGQQFYTQGLKRYPDALPDVFAAVEVWNTALDRSVYPVPLQDIWMDRDSMELGTAGFAVQDGLYLPRSAVDEAWIEDTVSLRVFSFLTKKSFLKYVASPKQITRGGVTALEPGCSSDNEVVNTGISVLVELGYVCVDSWWLTPACAALGDRWQEDCFAVLDDDWGYIKAELYGAMATSDMLAAKLTVGYESMNAVISSRKFTVAFCWWSTDTQYLDLEPVRISLPEESDPQRVIVSKEVYRPVLDNLQVKVLLSQMNMNNKELDAILKNVSETVQHRPAAAIATWDYFQKVACDWIRSNEARWQAWLPDSRSCQPGEYYDTDAARCAACPAGSRWERGRGSSPNRCLACAAGSFSAVPGQSACQLCPPGQFLNYTGGVACRPCAIGRVATSTGSRSCVWCSANRSTPALWTTMRLAEGAEQWILTDGAADMRACGCSPGSFQIDEGHCMVCTEGMRCDGMGSGVPETLPGYYATLSQPFSIYECLDREICPGGPPETCAGAHLGLVCALCPQGRRRGSCGECAAYARVLILICPVLVVIFVALLYYSSTVTVTVNASVSLTASVWLGMVMTCFQVFSLVGGMNIEWPGSGSSSYFAGTSITMLNLDQFAPECAIGQEAVLLYLLRVLTPPLVLAAAVVVWAASRLLSRCGSSIPCVDADRMVNTVGQVLQLFFIPFAVIATRALECKRHPNGTKSMVLFPEVLCFTQGHVTLLGLSVLLNLLFLVPYFALTIWVIAVAPNRTGAGGARFFTRYCFLLYRFRPDVWWWGLAFLIRQLGLAFATVVTANDAHGQIMWVSILLCIYVFRQCGAWPWKNTELNIFDTCTTSLLIFIVITSGSFVPEAVGKARTYFMVLGLFAIFILIIIVGMALIIIVQFFRKGLNGEFIGIQPGETASKPLAQKWISWSKFWSGVDPILIKGAIELLNRFDRTTLGSALKVWEAVCPDGVDGATHLSGMRFSRCAGWEHSTADIPANLQHYRIAGTASLKVTSAAVPKYIMRRGSSGLAEALELEPLELEEPSEAAAGAELERGEEEEEGAHVEQAPVGAVEQVSLRKRAHREIGVGERSGGSAAAAPVEETAQFVAAASTALAPMASLPEASARGAALQRPAVGLEDRGSNEGGGGSSHAAALPLHVAALESRSVDRWAVTSSFGPPSVDGSSYGQERTDASSPGVRGRAVFQAGALPPAKRRRRTPSGSPDSRAALTAPASLGRPPNSRGLGVTGGEGDAFHRRRCLV